MSRCKLSSACRLRIRRREQKLTTVDSASQTERISLIKVALMNKVGKDALKHYDLGPEDSEGAKPTDSTNANTIATNVNNPTQADTNDEEGLHL